MYIGWYFVVGSTSNLLNWQEAQLSMKTDIGFLMLCTCHSFYTAVSTTSFSHPLGKLHSIYHGKRTPPLSIISLIMLAGVSQ